MLKKDGSKTDWVNIPIHECLEGNAIDAYYTAKVYTKLLEELRLKKLDKLYEKLISPITPVFAEMEMEGLLIDTKELESLDKAISEKIEATRIEMMNDPLIPQDSNLNSDRDVIKILYSLDKNKEKEWEILENVGFGLYPFSRTDKGQPKSDEETLEILRDMVDKEYAKRGLNVE